MIEIETIRRRLSDIEGSAWQYWHVYDILDNKGNRLMMGHYIIAPDVTEPYKGLRDEIKDRLRQCGYYCRLIAECHTGEKEADFIAHAPQDIRYLLSDVDRLSAEVERMKSLK